MSQLTITERSLVLWCIFVALSGSVCVKVAVHKYGVRFREPQWQNHAPTKIKTPTEMKIALGLSLLLVKVDPGNQSSPTNKSAHMLSQGSTRASAGF